jgi:5-methylcytosine-specific restriction endonuclease McrA
MMPNKIPVFRPVKAASVKTMAIAEHRPNTGQRGYDAKWQRYRLEFIRHWVQTHGPYCAACGGPIDFAKQTHVDHIDGHDGQDDPKFWSYSNLQVLHMGCHTSKTNRETKGGGVCHSLARQRK